MVALHQLNIPIFQDSQTHKEHPQVEKAGPTLSIWRIQNGMAELADSLIIIERIKPPFCGHIYCYKMNKIEKNHLSCDFFYFLFLSWNREGNQCIQHGFSFSIVRM